ncbi:MAG: hypothetical protein ACPGOV_14520 [Magnetovibrionaceae bacterium]
MRSVTGFGAFLKRGWRYSVSGAGLAGLLLAASNTGTAAEPAETARVAPPPSAEERPIQDILPWLMDQPATLFDMGLFRLKLDLDLVARRLEAAGYAEGPIASGAIYDWRSRRGTAYLSLRDRLDQPSAALCQEVFARMAGALTARAPQGPGRGAWYLENLFRGGGGFGPFGRPQNMGDMLVDQVRFEVVILPIDPMAGGTVHCSGKLDDEINDLVVQAAK